MTAAFGTTKIAVLSDTHGLLRPEAVAACEGVDAILHAGDIGSAAVLEELRQLAPLTAIRGNIDTKGACAALPASEMVTYGAATFYLVHDLRDLDISPAAAGVQVVVSGHSHKPHLEHRNGVLYLNPGSVGPRRFRLPVAMAFLFVKGQEIKVEELRFQL